LRFFSAWAALLKTPFSFSPGFSRVSGSELIENRFNGFLGEIQKTVETVPRCFAALAPG